MMNTEDWYHKKIDEGFYGFNVFSLDEVFDETEIKEMHSFIKDYQNQLDNVSEFVKNHRTSNSTFVEWFKKFIEDESLNRDRSRDGNDSIKNIDQLYNDDGNVIYTYQFVRDAFYIIYRSSLSLYEKVNIPCISDLAVAFTIGNVAKKFNNKVVNKVTKKALKYLYNDDVNNYDLFKQHINIIPPYGNMGVHEDAASDERDFTIILYLNTEWEKTWEGQLKFLIPTFSSEYIVHDNARLGYDKFSRQIQFNVEPICSNVVVMNHTINDDVASKIQHEVDINLSKKNRYSMYNLYRRK